MGCWFSWLADIQLADTQLISKFNKGIRFLLCVINIFIKYAWAVPLLMFFNQFKMNPNVNQTQYG